MNPLSECSVFKTVSLQNGLVSCVTVIQHAIFQKVNYEQIFALHKVKYSNSVICNSAGMLLPIQLGKEIKNKTILKCNVTDTKTNR
jgi:hypothetical protein